MERISILSKIIYAAIITSEGLLKGGFIYLVVPFEDFLSSFCQYFLFSQGNVLIDLPSHNRLEFRDIFGGGDMDDGMPVF